MIVVVEEDDVQVGGVAQFLAPQFAIADDGEARRVPVADPKGLPGEADDFLQQQVGQVRKVVGQAFQGQETTDVLGHQTESLGLLEMAQDVHLALGVAFGGVELGAQGLGQGLALGFVLEHAGVQQFVQQHGMVGEIVRDPGACAHQPGHLPEGLGVLGEQGEVSTAAPDLF